jgi:alkaline phosphatase D
MRSRKIFNPMVALFSYVCLLALSHAALGQSAPAEASQEGYPRLMQGPMIGAVAEDEIRIWARLSGEYGVSVEYGTSPDLETFEQTPPMKSQKANDFTVVVSVGGLEPDTEYFYRMKVNGEADRYLEDYPPFRMKTAPRPGASHDFSVGFGSCPRFGDDRLQPIWSAVDSFEPDLFLWIGDNIYGDSLYPEILQEEYRRQRDVDALQPVLHNVSHLAVWDDHDYGLNNHNKSNPIKESALEIFKQYWANPSYGLPDVPGVFFRYTYGQVDFFFVDDRYYRDADSDPDSPQKTMLGASQLSWLKTELEASTAIFKVLVAGGGWNNGKGVGEDSWASFQRERNEIFDFIRDREINGVIFLSGDTHVGELNVIPWSEKGGYDYYDFASSPLAQDMPDSWLERRPERRVRSVYFQGSNFGLVEFFFEPTPQVRYRLIDTHGRSVWETFEVTAAELVNGVTSWPSKVSELERLRQLDYEAGKGYYEVIHED